MDVFICLIDELENKFSFRISSVPTIIGRASQAHIKINDLMCSGQHCQVYLQKNQVMVEDLKSKNGIKVNGLKIHHIALSPGQIVELGSCTLQIDLDKTAQQVIDKLKMRDESGKTKSFLINMQLHRSPSSLKDIKADPFLIPKNIDSNRRHKSKKKNFLRTIFAYIFDVVLYISLFLAPLYLMRKINPRIYSQIIQSDFGIISHPSIVGYFIAAVLIPLLLYLACHRILKQSLGQKIFKV